jgi:hypothetical protein
MPRQFLNGKQRRGFAIVRFNIDLRKSRFQDLHQNGYSGLAPGFQGYIEVVCNFPFAHGFGFFSDVGARNLAATIPALILPLERSSTIIESAGQ